MTTPRSHVWVISALVLLFLMMLACVLVPIPYLTRSPGPVFDILGTTDDGKPVLVIKGAKSFETPGTLDMTTVSETGGDSGPINVGAALAALISRTTSVSPDPLALKGIDQSGEQAVQRANFDASQSNALGAAAAYLDRPVHTQAVVMEVVPGSPADGRLQAGDIIEQVDGKPVANATEIGKAIRAQPAGTTFTFTVQRGKASRDVEVTSTSVPADSGDSGENGDTGQSGQQRAAIGILVDNHYTSNFTAQVNLDNIGGPSAGLMLSLAMVDRLTPEQLVDGRIVAGTGTIEGDGHVGPIGGIDKKMIAASDAGAQLFLAPAENCDEVVTSRPSGLTVVPVTTLKGAIQALDTWRSGAPVTSCPAASASAQNR